LEIRKLWFKYGIWDDSVSRIYYEVFGKELSLISDDIILFNKKDLDILEEICINTGINSNVMKDIFNLEKKYMGFNNRQELNKNLRKLLSQEFLHLGNIGDNNEN
jgi:DNA sulfur modification protein DndC